MRGQENPQLSMFSYLSLEHRIPADHPLRRLRLLVDGILANMSTLFDERYSHTGRPSIPPERLLRALLLQILFTVRSERLLMEQLDYNLLFCGTMIEAWASHKSFVRKDGSGPEQPPGRNPEVDFKGEKRSNATHQSSTDPQSRLYKKGEFTEAKLRYMTHALAENRNGLIVDVETTQANGRAEWEAAQAMIARSVRKPGASVAGLHFPPVEPQQPVGVRPAHVRHGAAA